MIKGSEKRQPSHAVQPLFVDRWSPRAMSGAVLSDQELYGLFEAARWAPSASNLQPWRILYARRDTPQWQTYLSLLIEFNQVWAKQAGALLVFISDTYNEAMKMNSITSSFDTGAAWENLALQGFQSGLVVHGMAGFSYEQTREKLQIPERYKVEAMVAVGKPGAVDQLPEKLQAREMPSDRRPLEQTVCEGVFAW
jgi:nitroreductase